MRTSYYLNIIPSLQFLFNFVLWTAILILSEFKYWQEYLVQYFIFFLEFLFLCIIYLTKFMMVVFTPIIKLFLFFELNYFVINLKSYIKLNLIQEDFTLYFLIINAFDLSHPLKSDLEGFKSHFIYLIVMHYIIFQAIAFLFQYSITLINFPPSFKKLSFLKFISLSVFNYLIFVRNF